MTNSPPPDDLLAALGHLGFGQYEARAYCTLLSRSPLNGHEVAKASGIPPSKIYETLARLVEKGAVLVERSEPVTYAPSPRTAVLEAARRKFERACDAAEAGLSRLPAQAETGQVWSMRERDTVLAVCAGLAASARTTVHAAIWDEEAPALGAALEAASRRGCAVHVAVYGTARLDGPRTYDLTLCGQSAVERLGGRRLCVFAVDQERTIVAEFHADGSVEAISTDNRVLALLAVEYVKADVLGRLLIDDLGQDRFDALRRASADMDALLRS